MGVGKSLARVDARVKTTGEAKYAADTERGGMLVARVLRSTIASGVVKSMDVSLAEALPGVKCVVTCFDVPDIQFPTPGHPWSTEKAHQDVCDRKLLNARVRVYGDDIAAVVAQDAITAERALRLIKVVYEEYEPYVTVEQAMAEGAIPVHDEKPDNVLAHSHFALGDMTYDEAARDTELVSIKRSYATQTVQHCHLETPQSYAYMENDRIIVVSSTQIPHIVRRVIGQALGIPWGRVRVIKPYIGGGFGNKQEVLYEPLNAFLCVRAGGRPVKLELTREETFCCTRVRHAIRFDIEALAKKDGALVARRLTAYSNQGGYASHGHAIVANGVNEFKQIYRDGSALECDAYTVYTNITTGGAMRGYGVPQAAFAAECMADDMAKKLGMDPVDFRLKNCAREGYTDPHTNIAFRSYGLKKCIELGRERFSWDEKRRLYAGQTGSVRRGVGMSIFMYKSNVHPISLETAACRMTLNQDGSVMLQMGATEIGQGADTVFTQMAAETTGITEDRIYLESTQDTDISPFDTGAYASRQTYVSGRAIVKTGLELKRRILEYASYMLGVPAGTLTLRDNAVTGEGGERLDMADLAMEAFYSLDRSEHITAEQTSHCKDNTFASGACFAEVEVDIPLGKVKVLRIMNVHDSGVIINPALAKAQVHGGISMALGYALSEELLYDDRARPLNGNFLDYKMPTSMDTPDIEAEFVEIPDETGPFGNKALGEPPTVPPAAAVRNAVMCATGIGFDALPMSPQRLVERFMAEGLIGKGA